MDGAREGEILSSYTMYRGKLTTPALTIVTEQLYYRVSIYFIAYLRILLPVTTSGVLQTSVAQWYCAGLLGQRPERAILHQGHDSSIFISLAQVIPGPV